MEQSSRTKQSSPKDYAWVAEQHPELSLLRWWEVSAKAGWVVAEDIFDRIDPRIHDQEEGGGNLRLVIHIDGYTDGEGEGFEFDLFELLDRCSYSPRDFTAKKLREYADRLDAEPAR